jgi:MoxR-like ATPase
MPTTTRAKKPPAPKAPAGAPKVEPADFERIERFITTEVLVERALEMRVLIRGSLAGVNIHEIGKPGVAKSLGLREYAKCVVDAIYFEKVVHGMMPADAIIGGYNMPLFAATGEFRRVDSGYAPHAHIIFIDEVPRANGPTLDSILPLMNTTERAAEANGGMVKTPCLFVVTASNTWFDAENEQHRALSDRVTLMLNVEDVKSEDSFKEILRRDHERRQHLVSGALKRETITLDQLVEAQRQVQEVRISPEFLDAAAKLRREAAQEGLAFGPRRWVELGYVARANAWMANRDHTIPEDLAIIEHGMWRDPDDRPLAHKLVLPFHGRFEREASAKRQEAAKGLQEVEAIRPQVEGTPPSEELDQDVLTKAISASRRIDDVKKRVDKVLAEADSEKRDASALRELSNELLAVQKWFKANSLPTSYEDD